MRPDPHLGYSKFVFLALLAISFLSSSVYLCFLVFYSNIPCAKSSLLALLLEKHPRRVVTVTAMGDQTAFFISSRLVRYVRDGAQGTDRGSLGRVVDIRRLFILVSSRCAHSSGTNILSFALFCFYVLYLSPLS